MYHITFPQRSNRASWIFVGQITDLNDNPLDLTNLSLEFAVRARRGMLAGYGIYGEFGLQDCVGPTLVASTDNGKLTIIGLGLFRWAFTLDDMRTLPRGTYDTGLTMADANGQTVQLGVGPLAIIDGVVP
jgi:hypothetical protein